MESTIDTSKFFSDRFLGESRSNDLWTLLEKLDRQDEAEFNRNALVASALMLGKNGSSATAAIGAIPLLEDTISAKAIYLLAQAAAHLQDKESLSPAVVGMVANTINELAKICTESPYSKNPNTLEEQE